MASPTGLPEVPPNRPAVRIEPGCDPVATERGLRSLPDWFGIEESLMDYVGAAGRLPGYLAHLGHEVVGVLLVERHFPESAEIHLLAVDPRHHRCGIGRALLDAAERGLMAGATRFLQVKTLGASDPSEHYARTRRFCERSGFMPLEELDGLWPGNPCLVMVEALPGSAAG